ncbi:alpha/beta hydrolase [Kineococcus aurantiacus]|uniref:Alpha-beta hydrolase superfamily lysophospholipase n=1 Tax=Kineococcus aurantiacus TaxID=37633 RepID=A0A7Y9DL49_9ACTN|nr:alpha/beta hydrolase [Kineococcus aurantiacus]NYD22615.1 alpha-beta hydrolase superfamily lysophospholipase [Kineococcus aurantiacus]
MAPLEVSTHDGDPARVATVLPGRGCTCDAPLLHSTRALLRDRGWTVRTVRWTTPPAPEELLDLAPGLLDAVQSRQHLVVAKSLSTRLLPLALQRDLPGTWLTPLLREPQVHRAAAAASAPTLLVGGSADPYWDAAAARGSGQRVLEVPGADHSLEVAGDLDASLRVLRTVLAAVGEFLDDLP